MAQLMDIEEIRRRKKKRQFVKNLLIMMAATLVVAAVLYINNSEKVQLFLETKVFVEEEESGFPIALMDSGVLDIVPAARNEFAVLGKNEISVYTKNGAKKQAYSHTYVNPRIVEGENRVMFYDAGGKSVRISADKHVFFDKALEYPVYCADLNSSGMYAISGGVQQFTAQVAVYTADNNLVYEWRSADKPVLEVLLHDNNRDMVAVAVDAESGILQSSLHFFRLGSTEEPAAPILFPGELIVSAVYKDNGSLLVLTDMGIYSVSSNGKVLSKAFYEDGTVTMFANDLSRYAAVVLENDSGPRGGRVLVYDQKCQVVGEIPMAYEVRCLRTDGKSIYIQTDRGISKYSLDGELLKEFPITNAVAYLPYPDYLYYVTPTSIERVEAN